MLGVLPRIWRDPLAFFQQVALEQGGVARVGLGHFTLYLLSDPEAVQYVLADNASNYWKGSGLDLVKPVMGEGLATSTGDFWMRQRRLMQPSFQRKRIASLLPVMREVVSELIARWRGPARSGQPVDVAVDMSRLVQDLIFRTIFGASLGEKTASLAEALVEINKYMNSIVWSLLPIPKWIPTPRRRRFRRAMQQLDAVVYGLIEERRGAAGDDSDLMGRLLAARDPETGEAMTDLQLRDEIMTLFVAGHDTTASAAAWTLALLSQNPAVRGQVVEELAFLDGALPGADDLARLELLDRVLKESMRVYPPGWLLVRTPHADDTIGGYDIPKGAPLLISQYVIHRHPKLWQDPERFDPDRFLPERSQGRPRYAYFPYGGGQRLCIGNTFAQMALKLILAAIHQRYVLDLVPGHKLVPQPLTTLRPKHGVLMTIRAR